MSNKPADNLKGITIRVDKDLYIRFRKLAESGFGPGQPTKADTGMAGAIRALMAHAVNEEEAKNGQG